MSVRSRSAVWGVVAALATASPLLAAANRVYHERTTNLTGGSCGNYVDRLAPTSAQTDTIRFKVEFQTFTNQWRVYYTTDGSTPAGAFGGGSGSTSVLTASVPCTFMDLSQGGQIVDVATATIPAQPGGTVVKYVVSAWLSTGGPEIFGNSGTCATCTACTTSGCADLFQYTVAPDPTPTRTATKTLTPVPTSTFTNTPVPPTATFTKTITPTFTPSPTFTKTPVPPTNTFTPTPTRTNTSGPPPVPTPTRTPTFTATATFTATFTATPTPTFTFIPTPTGTPTLVVSSITPTSGSPSGAALSILGGGFLAGATVDIGGRPATGVSVVGPSQIDAVAPALSPGTLNAVVVTNPGVSFGSLPNGWFADFLDVPGSSPVHSFVEKLVRNSVTAGCGAGDFCPGSSVTRAQMAVFLLRSKDGPSYNPPACSTPAFPDVPCSSPFSPWVNELAARSVTAGCGGGNYCPGDPVTRAQMAVFLLRTHDGSSYVPPACVTPAFADVPCSSGFAPWVDELAARGITAGCGGGNYCPNASVTRGQMAVFLVTTFSLP